MDMNEVANLLHIAEKTIQWPKLKPIHDEAMRVLEGHADEMKGKAEQRAKTVTPKAVPKVIAPDVPEGKPEPETVKRREVPEEVE